ncbi:response regulator transcription factor [Sulfobacillus sp. hq2]|uniref:response regulator transcription factor n=1 Tax=Sulfobacillus TaxID=28033 RepID=UPI000CD1BEC3|nr:response regulator transcription factor [Sulfobacillus sp. hq2]POB09386.1 two-component system response regulator [Sulfobacillus sp. hq2]
MSVEDFKACTALSRIMVVEDEFRSQRLLRINLEPLGYQVQCYSTGEEALAEAATFDPDIVLLDLMLPRLSGYDVLHALREQSGVPVIVISARDQVEDRVKALGIGADDFIVKPYAMEELCARMAAVIRRHRSDMPTAPLTIGCLKIFTDNPQVLVGDMTISLSKTEYGVLLLLAKHVNRVIVADTLLRQVWGSEYEGNYSILHVTVSRLRKKIGQSAKMYIVTKPGIGYMLSNKECPV